MDTKAGGPGAFKRFDLARVPSPAFVIDEVAIARNLRILQDVGDRSGASILLALKAFSMWSLAPLVSRHLKGVCASGLWEARLGRQKFGGEVTTYCAGYKQADLPEIFALSDHVIFNSPGQKNRFRAAAAKARGTGERFDIGLRINPEHREGEVEKYDPCQPCSRLGHPISQLTEEDLEGVDGLHFHVLCEQDFPPLKRTWDAIRDRILPHAGGLKWLNMGGGHHITRSDYQRDDLVAFIQQVREETGLDVYLEPGEAIALDAGILVGEVLDVARNDMAVAIVDVSATCHMPDVIEAPYRPDLMGEDKSGEMVRIGGPSCLAGDIIGDYGFAALPEIGQRIAFLDQAYYSMVKTNTFNGVPLPAIALWNSDTDALQLVKSFGYDHFVDRLS